MPLPTYLFEVVPTGTPAGFLVSTDGFRFDPFVFEVPSLSGEDFAARRAWWSAFHLLGPRGVEPEEFEVFEFAGETRGRRVGMGGFEVAA